MGGKTCACLTCVGVVMGMRSASSHGASSCFEVRGTGRGRGIFLSLGLKVMVVLFLGFSGFLAIPSDDSES